MAPKPDQTENQPGADRFWGQFSQSTAGRSNAGESGAEDPRQHEGNDANGEPHDAHCLEWCPICRSAELFRTAVSPELRQQAESIQHEAMGVFKAFLDAYAEKSAAQGPSASGAGEPAAQDRPEDPPEPRVTDIPLD